MQTFLPFATYEIGAELLDDKRLNKQIVEAYQILTRRVPNTNHPACLMWKGYEFQLRRYALDCLNECLRRRMAHSLHVTIYEMQIQGTKEEPTWLGNKLFHFSHRVNLLRKDATHYAPLLKWIPTTDLDAYPTGYFWPVEPVGKKAKADRAAWIEWGKANEIEEG